MALLDIQGYNLLGRLIKDVTSQAQLPAEKSLICPSASRDG